MNGRSVCREGGFISSMKSLQVGLNAPQGSWAVGLTSMQASTGPCGDSQFSTFRFGKTNFCQYYSRLRIFTIPTEGLSVPPMEALEVGSAEIRYDTKKAI